MDTNIGTVKNGSYELVKAPIDYPGKKYRERYVYEHHLVWWKNTGQVVPEGFDVHHKNEQKRDNRFENLELKEHTKHCGDHASERGEGLVEIECGSCKKNFFKRKRHVEGSKKKGQKSFFCSNQCKFQGQMKYCEIA